MTSAFMVHKSVPWIGIGFPLVSSILTNQIHWTRSPLLHRIVLSPNIFSKIFPNRKLVVPCLIPPGWVLTNCPYGFVSIAYSVPRSEHEFRFACEKAENSFCNCLMHSGKTFLPDLQSGCNYGVVNFCMKYLSTLNNRLNIAAGRTSDWIWLEFVFQTAER